MRRVLFAALLAILSGCKSQNPFAAIGPATVPAPTTGSQFPYYPAKGLPSFPAFRSSAAPPSVAPAAAPSGRMSVSAESAPPLASTSPSAIVAEAADRNPIRIVESGAPGIRTATAPERGTLSPSSTLSPGSTVPQQTMPMNQPPSSSAPPANRIPGQFPSTSLPPASPAIQRMRGFATPAPTQQITASPRAVAPATYQQPVPTFSEIPSTPGQWRSR